MAHQTFTCSLRLSSGIKPFFKSFMSSGDIIFSLISSAIASIPIEARISQSSTSGKPQLPDDNPSLTCANAFKPTFDTGVISTFASEKPNASNQLLLFLLSSACCDKYQVECLPTRYYLKQYA